MSYYNKPTIFIVDDNDLVRNTITEALSDEGYSVVPLSNAGELLNSLKTNIPDIVLLDLILPDSHGLSLISKIREHTDVPILIISGKTDMVDKIVGLEMGADDYIGKPVEIKELTARIWAHIRRYRELKANTEMPSPKKREAQKIKFKTWILDRRQFQIYDETGTSGDLTVKEFRLLEALVLEPHCVLSREQLLDKVCAGDYDITDRAIDVQIARIRRKLGDSAVNSSIIQSVRGIGYKFIPDTEILE